MKLQTETEVIKTHRRKVPKAIGRENRRLALLKRSGLFGSNTNEAVISRACELDDLEKAYRLIYRMYLESNYITANSREIRVRPFEACPQTATFTAKLGKSVVGTLSLTMDSHDLGLPSDTSFKKELDEFRSRGISLCEATGEAVLPQFRKTGIATELMRCLAAQAWLEKRPIAVVSVSPNHASFHEIVGFRKLTDVRSYSKTVDDPVVLMSLDMEALKKKDPTLTPCMSYTREFLTTRNPYIHKVYQWLHDARRCFFDPNLLRKLFVTESRMLENCTEAQREAICRRWGDDLFEQVSGMGAPTVKLGDSLGRYIPSNAPRSDKKRTRRTAPMRK